MAELAGSPMQPECRNEILDLARRYTQEVLGATLGGRTCGPVIVSGHQPSWHHCGIWAKSVAVHRFANLCRGITLWVVLDHDIGSAALTMPRGKMDEGDGPAQLESPETCEHVPRECRPGPDTRLLRRFMSIPDSVPGRPLCRTVWKEEIDRIERTCVRCASVADVVTVLHAVLNDRLGLTSLLYLPVSWMAKTHAFRQFAAGIILDADAFHQIYNGGFAHVDSRRHDVGYKVRHLGRIGTDSTIELPFWLITPDGRRHSLHVKPSRHGRIGLGTSDHRLGYLDRLSCHELANQLARLVSNHGCRLRPKAVTLTLFIRLWGADWFVHGVGALNYESLTDYIIAEYYGVRPPRFGVATGTMVLADADWRSGSHDDVTALRARLRHVRFHPELYLHAAVRRQPSVASLTAAKAMRIRESRDPTLSHDQRHAAWRALGRINERLGEHATDVVIDIESRLAKAEASCQPVGRQDRREAFFGFFSHRALSDFADTSNFGTSSDNCTLA